MIDLQTKINQLDLISTSEASAIAGVSDSYIRRLCRDKRLPHFAGDKAYYIPRAAVLQFFGIAS